MAASDFLGALTGQQLAWFKQQSPVKQGQMAAQWQGSGNTPEDIVQDNGGPAPEGGSEALPDLQ
ncbi:hypothetical protein ACFU99_01730 [Streptomyces sp. NPDC057654]|uniref:hypothetical protein n=1 Tax=Streptomyces sp. NPDC057654 TaxID=3346196 RepID=UPI00369F627E